MRQVTDLLVGGGFYRLLRNGRKASKLVLLHGAPRFQLALVSQWTVATILGLHSRDGNGRQKDKVYYAFGCFGCTQKLSAQSRGVCWLSHTVQSLFCSSSLTPRTKGLPVENQFLTITSAQMMVLNQNLAHIKNSSSLTF